MAMRDLLEGECGGPNAVAKLTSHVTRDRAHRQNELRHLAGPATASPRSLVDATDDQVVQEFLREASRPETRGPTSFRMSSLLQEMREIERGSSRRPVTAPNVAHLAAEPAVWAEQFSTVQRQQGDEARDWALELSRDAAPPPGVAASGFLPVHWSADVVGRPINQPATNPLDEVQWLDQYKPSEDTELQRTADQILGSADDPDFSGSEFMSFLAKIRDGEVSLPEPAAAEVHETAQADPVTVADVPEEPAEAAAPEVDSAGMSPRAREEFWARLEREWAELYKSDEHPWLSSDNTDPFSLQEYRFEPDNGHTEDPDPLAEGQRRLAAGDLPGAVLCFEAAAQRQPESVLAWRLLGTSLAENEQDPQAITALRKCIELEPTCLPAYMALAASYTNESYPMQACATLREWLRHHSDYRHLVSEEAAARPAGVFQPSVVTPDFHDRVRDEFLAAARLRPSRPDPDVQCGLGVLLHMAGEYERAVDCFNAALIVQPENAQLWNKVGATLANGDQPERAVAAYSRALQLSPGFIRARFNLGISCRSLNANREAVEHFMTALEHQASSRGASGQRSAQAMSHNIWSMLRMTLATMGRSDLFTAVDSRDLATLSREFGSGGGGGAGQP
ncbi:peroxisomal targeting signal 1 receptor-like [Pollicipes pollicipes]|uniref:peroxisomal targeting signal 1 receptor-like n=1 Tax=Pollicipes pollicipes TaxID=41117 RepID=UPI001884A276|nr:peroxisomal targeting signal 1 receptor-like [Pollicipes pollicipes]XP_037085330.1 peroxisomal targeting signal 1 receptor-like [Pollicipes pollicipes]